MEGRPRKPAGWGCLGLVVTVGLALGTGPGTLGGTAMTMTIRSEAFDNGGAIPRRYTCDGADVSPPLAWEGVPEGARSLVLVVDDPDAPDPAAPRTTWVHWVLYDLPPDGAGLDEGGDPLPAGTRQGLNGWSRPGYGGPCPPVGRHRYFFKLFAVDRKLGDLGPATKSTVLAAAQGHVVAQAQWMGTYARP